MCTYVFFLKVLVSQRLCPDGSIKLIFTEFADAKAKRIHVLGNPKRTCLYIPLLRQCSAFGRSPLYFAPIDLRCNRKSAFSRSNCCKKWQPIRFTQVCKIYNLVDILMSFTSKQILSSLLPMSFCPYLS